MDRDREDLTSVYVVNGPLYTKEDCKDHECVGMFIRENNKVLILYHVKMDMWAIPVGKVKSNQSVEEALREEANEELGIDIIQFKEIITTYRPYIINSINVRVDYHIFEITKYDGKIENCEPHKHKNLKFVTIEDTKTLKNKSTAMKLIIRYLENAAIHR